MREFELSRVSRSFGAVQALDDVSLTLKSGEINALVGENGAGKSTLIRILAGLERPDTGQLRMDGAELPAANPAAMRSAGLRFIHQELHAVGWLSVAENMHLDHPYPGIGGFVNWRSLNRTATEGLRRLDLGRIDPRAPMSELGAGDQMLVRIAASLIETAGPPPWLYVMDEPTAALTSEETDRLFAVISGLVQRGAGVLYVSHRMPEVMQLADRISVLRDGRSVSTRRLNDTTQAQVIEDMTGRNLRQLFPRRRENNAPGDVVLRVRGLRSGKLKRADFELRAGEVLGIAGVSGSGRGTLLRVLLGDIAKQGGSADLDGQPLGRTPEESWKNGLAYVPRERRSEGLMMRRKISENIVLPHLSGLSRAGCFLDHSRQKRVARQLGERVRLKAQSVAQHCEELSGGNQQKVLFARALVNNPRVLLLDEPTRGVDIGARHELYRLIRQFSEQGLAVIISSSDLPELIGLSDRIAILRDGAMADIVEAASLSEADLLSRFYAVPEGEAA